MKSKESFLGHEIYLSYRELRRLGISSTTKPDLFRVHVELSEKLFPRVFPDYDEVSLGLRYKNGNSKPLLEIRASVSYNPDAKMPIVVLVKEGIRPKAIQTLDAIMSQGEQRDYVLSLKAVAE